jgi:glycosyltransferase involved in cell wall biosynthesis
LKKVIWILHEGNISGANLAAYDYAKVLLDHSWRIKWVLPSNGSFNQFLEDENQETKIIGFYGWMIKIGSKVNLLIYLRQRIRNFLSICKIVKLIIKEKPDIVFTNTITFSVGAFASLYTFKKHFWFIHEFGEEDHGIKIFPFPRLSCKFLGSISSRVIVNSKATFDKFNKMINNSKIKLCYYPIKLNPLKKENLEIEPNHIYSFILIGQIAEGKGHLEVLKAFATAEKEIINYKLNIYGNIVENDYYTKLVEFIEANALDTRVRFYPNNNEPLKVIANHDFLIMASRMEAFGKVTFEALSVGTPVIGKNRGGTKELVLDKYNGFLYEDEDELIQILTSILNNKTEIQKLSENAFEFVQKKFDYKKTSQTFYRSLDLK